MILTFEHVEYDYTLESNEMPELGQHTTFADAVREVKPYSYIRANRMKSAGATNRKIIFHDGTYPPDVYYNNIRRAEPLDHSCKTLSKNSMANARMIQTSKMVIDPGIHKDGRMLTKEEAGMDVEVMSEFKSTIIPPSVKSTTIRAKPSAGSGGKSACLKPNMGASSKSGGSQSVVSVTGFQIGRGVDDDSSVESDSPDDMRRRVSWAFENGLIPEQSQMGLQDTKALLRSQIRSKGDDVPPDFVYLTINAIHANMKPTEASRNMEANTRDQELALNRKVGRPASSPSRLDPRIRLPIDELDWDEFCFEISPQKTSDEKSEAGGSQRTGLSARSRKSTVPQEVVDIEPPTTMIVTEFSEVPVDAKPRRSLYSENVKSSIPKAYVLRPHTAKVYRSNRPGVETIDARPKSSSAVMMRTDLYSRLGSTSRISTASRPPTALRPGTAKTTQTLDTVTSQSDNARTKKTHGFSTSATPLAPMVPMLMYSPELKNRIAELKEERIQRQGHTTISLLDEDQQVQGNVSEYNHPLRNHVDFKLLTHEQTVKNIADKKGSFKDTSGKEKQEQEKKQRAAWLAKVKGRLDKSYTQKPGLTPEIREFGEAQTVI